MSANSQQEFFIGQRWISNAELHLGLGMVIEIEPRTVSIIFPASTETRIYSRQDPPLTRVRFRIGDRVEDQQEQGLKVNNLLENKGLIVYQVEDEEGNQSELPEGKLSNYLQLNQPEERLLNGQIDRNKWYDLRCEARQTANWLLQSPIYGLAGCRTSLIEHQLYIAHEVSRRYAPRVLLADEVGLGKTIEAGLILHQQLLLERAHRVLIVVPESLMHQWLVEMLRRFNLKFSIFDAARCLDTDMDSGESLSDDPENPFHEEQLILCSLQFLLDHPEQAAQATAGEWDLLVVDEAHHLSWSSEEVSPEYALVETLAKNSAGLMLLTATPEQLGVESHFARLRLLDPDRFSDLNHFLQEQSGYGALADQVEAMLGDDSKTTELEDLLDRHGTGRVLFRNTRQVVEGFPERDVHPYVLVEAAAGVDPRRQWLVDFLRENRQKKILVIAAAAQTALDLVDQLQHSAGIHAAVFHEGMSLIERDRAAAWFSDPEDGAPVLICSEIGSEGRNFQFAHHLVLFDLPVNPDLLEQRIGRLDRIGQIAVINIHVPYLQGSAGEVLYRWYQEGLNAFTQTCPAGHQVYVNSQHELQRFLDDPSLPIDDFLDATAKMHGEFDLALQQGRDRLLEINSCRPALAAELADQAAEREYEVDIFNFMERIYDCYGVDSEIRGHQAWVLTPGDNMLTKMPGLPDDGMTVTYNRNVALANEDLHFLSWEHPFVRNSMDMILSSEFGNTALIAVQYPGVRPGSLLAECQFLVDYSNQGKMNSERYFPNSSIRIVIDEAGNHHQDKINFATIPREIQRVHVDTAIKVVKARQNELTDMLARAEIAANGQVPELVDAARQQGQAVLGREVDRLVSLQKVNPGVRSEEIEFFENQLALFNDSLSHARVRLDAVRVMVAL